MNKEKVVSQSIHSNSTNCLYLLKEQHPLWSAMHYSGRATLITLVLMPGELKEWHENPKPQWIIPLHGKWGVETMDGVIVEMGPGEISFGGDQ